MKKLITPSKKIEKEHAKSIRADYRFRKQSLEKDVKLLWSETPGNSMFDSADYTERTISCHPYLNDSEKGVIPSEKREILGLDFLVDYFTTINRFKDGVQRYHPNINWKLTR